MKKTIANVLISVNAICLAILLYSCISSSSAKNTRAAKPFYLSGKATFEDGRPIPEFLVQARGFTGNFNLYAGTANFSVNGKGTNGVYNLHAEQDATLAALMAQVTIKYHGHNYTRSLYPLDGLRDDGSEGGYRARVKNGATRNFVMKMSGVKPGYKEAECPTQGTDNLANRAWMGRYGGGIAIECDWPSTATGRGGLYRDRKIKMLIVTLTPNGPLLDGSAGKVLSYEIPMNTNTSTAYINDIPFGSYTATGSFTETSGGSFPLRWRLKGPTDAYNSATNPWTTSTTIEWQPLETSSDPSGSVITSILVFAGQ